MKKNEKEDFSEADERNIQFQQADAKRWLEQDFVIGVEVKRSGNCDPDCEICEEGAGKYPKDYEWTIWHPGCLCSVIPIMLDEDDFIDSLFDKEDGEKPDKGIKEFPEKMKKFMQETGFEHYGHEDYFEDI